MSVARRKRGSGTFTRTSSQHLSDKWLTAGSNEHELVNLNSWMTTQMVGRYAQSNAIERAKAAHTRLAPGDEI